MRLRSVRSCDTDALGNGSVEGREQNESSIWQGEGSSQHCLGHWGLESAEPERGSLHWPNKADMMRTDFDRS